MITLLAVVAIVFLVFKGRSAYYGDLSATPVATALNMHAERHKLNMDRVLVRNSWGLALDKGNGQLLYVASAGNDIEAKLLSIDGVADCDILKTHTSRLTIWPRRQHKKYIERILLHIKHADDDCQIPFFHFGKDKLVEMKMLYRQARQWQRLIKQ